ncbi:MAG: hypothetical protein JSW06_02825 [Thermoplasmatales archaeon]|nr:MAG: hypothetical protein JSW06_02825 [Thermoplasmatales archaeon]
MTNRNLEQKLETQSIQCPHCGTTQQAEVVRGEPFDIYFHECTLCKYKITESEWKHPEVYYLDVSTERGVIITEVGTFAFEQDGEVLRYIGTDKIVASKDIYNVINLNQYKIIWESKNV